MRQEDLGWHAPGKALRQNCTTPHERLVVVVVCQNCSTPCGRPVVAVVVLLLAVVVEGKRQRQAGLRICWARCCHCESGLVNADCLPCLCLCPSGEVHPRACHHDLDRLRHLGGKGPELPNQGDECNGVCRFGHTACLLG